jgi:heme-degrading monooxygenase HmoA
MYTSVVDLTTKQGTARELTQAVNDKVRPILEKQTGFVDVTVIVSDTEPNRVLALSFWNTREDVQRLRARTVRRGAQDTTTHSGNCAGGADFCCPHLNHPQDRRRQSGLKQSRPRLKDESNVARPSLRLFKT